MSEYVKKVCICGDPSVGKTSLVKRFVTGKYDEKYISTLGTVVSKKSVKSEKNKCNVTMMLWDISGQPEFMRIHASAFKNATGGFAVCDLTRPDTAEHLEDWISRLRKHAGEDVPVTVLANKCDLTEETEQNMKALHYMLEGLGIPLYLTSAKTGENVNEAFKNLADMISYEKEGGDSPIQSLAIGMPENFANPKELLDYVVVQFCNALGDEEMGMHMIRKQVKDQDINFRKVSKEAVGNLTEQLVPIILQFKGDEAAKKTHALFKKAFNRCEG